LRVRGVELVTAANARALWALIWFLAVYHCGLGRPFASCLPRPPERWSAVATSLLSPVLILWGIGASGLMIRNGLDPSLGAGDYSLFNSFPFVMLVGAILLIVTGRTENPGRPIFTAMGLATAASYVLIWMFNGKRSHSLMGVLATVCAFYITRQKRPSWPVLLTTAVAGAVAVSIAIGWRNDRIHDRSVSGFVDFVAEFDPSTILKNVNVEIEEDPKVKSYETEEYGGFLIMMTAVPSWSDYDYGQPYLKVFSTFIPRFIWRDKPIFGREEWVGAWIAASEFKRDRDFTGPAIGILGATQLNGGAWGTAIVIGFTALVLRVSYDYFRIYAHVAWVQAWWAITFFNAWFMVVNDDPLVWFYYNWGFTTMPFLGLLWFANAIGHGHATAREPRTLVAA
jgi:hypothetical protein